MSDVKREDMIELLLPVSGVGQATAEAVVGAMGTDMDRLLSATEEELTQVNGVGTTTARAIRKRLRFLDKHGTHTPVEALEHHDQRKNIPTDQLSQLVDLTGDGDADVALYPRDPELDPQLVWRGKDQLDGKDLSVPIVPVYIQEKIVPEAIVENLRDTAGADEDEPELSLFDDFDGLPEDALFDFYEHDANWSNRMILGDALVAMTSLAEKENLKGEVQTIYLDPPYGIKFQSNWQVSTRDRSVSDQDITRQPEQVRAFRDTWKNGVHSYLTYLRDRLQVAHTLLSRTGSIFVQMGEENVHTVRSLLDEVFGSDNFISVITVRKTSGDRSTSQISGVCDYLIWYARDVENMKYRQLYWPMNLEDLGAYREYVDQTGEVHSLTPGQSAGVEDVPEGARVFTTSDLTSQNPGSRFEVEFEGESYTPGNRYWSTTREGIERLKAAGRIRQVGKNIRYIRYLDDSPGKRMTNLWDDTGRAGFAGARTYVVQTNPKIVERCLLMTTDPGDLVLDPTCGSGTTAFAAEKWGRRWITMDTSRVALALSRARLMGARYPYWILADSPEGAKAEGKELGRSAVEPTEGYSHSVRKGFVYKRVPKVTMATVANCEDIDDGMSRREAEAAIRRCAELEVMYDQPREDKRRIRVTGPFTVESLSPHRKLGSGLSVSPAKERGDERDVLADQLASSSNKQDFGETVIENLKRAGVQNGYRDERLEFETLEPYADGAWIAATGSYKAEGGEERIVAVSIGPEHGTVGREQVNRAALHGAKIGSDLVLVCGFAFDGGATEEAADATEREFPVVGDRTLGRVRVLNVRINADLMMDEELKSTGSGNLFMVFGEPDIELEVTDEDQLVARLRGVDVYDPVKNEVRSSDPTEAMAWFIDTDYDESQFFVRHAYFTGDPEEYDPYAQLKRALDTEIDHEAWDQLHSTESLPFPKPQSGKIAVKVINHYGDEVLKVFSVR